MLLTLTLLKYFDSHLPQSIMHFIRFQSFNFSIGVLMTYKQYFKKRGNALPSEILHYIYQQSDLVVGGLGGSIDRTINRQDRRTVD